GELIEIGGGFRVPDVCARSGAALVEVGTTNRTRTADYERAFSDGGVAAILRVHQGNFRQTGFVERPSLRALAELCRSRPGLVFEGSRWGAPAALAVDRGPRRRRARGSFAVRARGGADGAIERGGGL